LGSFGANIASSTGVADWPNNAAPGEVSAPSCIGAPAHDLREGGDDRRHAFDFTQRREGHVERFITACTGQRVELELEPARIIGTHVHR